MTPNSLAVTITRHPEIEQRRAELTTLSSFCEAASSSSIHRLSSSTRLPLRRTRVFPPVLHSKRTSKHRDDVQEGYAPPLAFAFPDTLQIHTRYITNALFSDCYSQVPHHRRPADQHGQDRLLHDLCAAAREQTAQLPQVRSRGAEEGAVFGGEERKINKWPDEKCLVLRREDGKSWVWSIYATLSDRYVSIYLRITIANRMPL